MQFHYLLQTCVKLLISGTATTGIESVPIKKPPLCHDLTSITSYMATLAVKSLRFWIPNIFSVLLLYNVHRIKSLSDAVDDLYKQFNTLKDNLAKLTSKFDKVEDFVDELQAGKIPKAWLWKTPQRPPARVPTQTPMRASGRGQWIRRARARRGPGT